MAAVAYGQRSPTLSDAGMILPAFEPDFAHAFSPSDFTDFIDRPPSPPLLYADTVSYVKLHSAPHGRRRLTQHELSSSPSAHSSRSTLHTMVDSEAAASGVTDGSNTLASSPTIQDPLDADSPSNWNGHDTRRTSTASSSSLSGDFNNWPGFDSNGAGLDAEHREQQHQHPAGDSIVDDAALGDDADIEQWSRERSSGSSDDEDEPYSSAALSRRAEIILANAKKRLNVRVTAFCVTIE